MIAGASLCNWNNGNCSINQPPNEVTFLLVVAFIVIIFVIPLDYAVDYIIEEYASKRPRLERWGLSTDSWLGSVFHFRKNDVSPIVIAVAHLLSQRERFSEQESLTDITNEESMKKIDPEMSEMCDEKIDLTALRAYGDLCSPVEELDRIV